MGYKDEMDDIELDMEFDGEVPSLPQGFIPAAPPDPNKIAKAGGKPDQLFLSPEQIKAYGKLMCDHKNVREIELFNFTVKECEDCGKEIK